MFLVNSRFPLVSAAPIPSHQQVVFKVGAPLLPKLRGHFAEFLNHNSLDRLSILYLITCVGLGYGRLKPRVDAFLGSIGSLNSPVRGTHRISDIIDDGFAYRQPYILTPGSPYGYHRLAQLPSCVTPVHTLTAPAWGRALDRPPSPRRDPVVPG